MGTAIIECRRKSLAFRSGVTIHSIWHTVQDFGEKDDWKHLIK